MHINRRHALIKATIIGAAMLGAACTSNAPTLPPAPDTQPLTWNQTTLTETVNYVRDQNSTGFLIIHNGQTISETYWPLPDSAAQFKANFTHGATDNGILLEDVASAQKSFIAILAGVAIDNGQLDTSKSVTSYLGAGWSKATPDAEARITVRNLLEMNSGLNEALEVEADPDETFLYNTPAYAILKPVLETVSGQPLDKLTHDWLTEPAGMTDTAWRQRPEIFARYGNPTGLVTTPRDLAIMGQLILDSGVTSNGTRIISKAQTEAMFTPTATNPAYGKLWWLNGGDFHMLPVNKAKLDGPLIPAAPADLIAAQGAQDRKLYIVPSLNLIVVRSGMATTDRDFNQQLWTRLMQAIPTN